MPVNLVLEGAHLQVRRNAIPKIVCHPERSLRLFFRPASLRVGRRRSRGTCCSARSRTQNSCSTHWAGQLSRHRAPYRRSRFICPYFPGHTAGDCGFRQSGRTTVTPWSFRNSACRRMRRSLTRAFRFVALACIPIGMLRRKRRHVSARILHPCNSKSGNRRGPRNLQNHITG